MGQDAIARGNSVVVDNTNPTPLVRSAYLRIARVHKVKCRCFWFRTSRVLAEHLNLLREKQTRGKRPRLPTCAFDRYESTFSRPTLKEGFDDVISIHFSAYFPSEAGRKQFLQFT